MHDEDEDDLEALESGADTGADLGDPDWDRYLIKGGPAQPPVGDPTRWGSQTLTLVPAAGLQTSTQILAASTRDAYSRSWGMIGTLSLPSELWNAVAGVAVSLDVSMGVGQALLTQRIALFSALAVSQGLCITQYEANGGPYQSITDVVAGVPIQTRAFAAIGAIVGQSVNIRVRYSIAAAFASLPTTSELVIALTPFAAGQGL